MSGRDATKQLLSAMSREDVVDAALVARALGLSKRKVLRDWRSRQLPETNVGRDIRLSSDLVLRTYFPHHLHNSPAT